MIDERLKTLAKNLINYSCSLQPGEKILIEAMDTDEEFLCELVKETYKIGACPFVKPLMSKLNRELLKGTTEQREKLRCDFDLPVMENMNAYISVRSKNVYENSDVPKENLKTVNINYNLPVHHNTRVAKTKWVILNYPTSVVAQNAGMSTEAFEDFYFDVCNLDYSKMEKAMQPLKELIEKTDKVRIVAPGTDLTFSIKGMPAIKCCGKNNIPDGEIFTAPVKNSVNGVIKYNIPILSSNGERHEDVTLTFENGKIINATSKSNEDINKIFNTDEGARYVGEFAFGVNPYIKKPMLDILFDEKIMGSIHFTPGSCYDECDNGNKSAIHWDLIQIQTPEYGGGEIYFDDVLIRKDGKFVLEELKVLNPENLI
ncbi:MAG: aminopeptidase [Clostridia bacterium]|nr:aminopeptidase [Clostridia bacterium]